MATAIAFGWQVENAAGTPVSGAKIYFYVPNTTTPRTPFSDTGLSVPTANPVIADAAGWFLVYLSSDLAYDIVVKSADDSITYQTRAVQAGSGGQPANAKLTALSALTLADNDLIRATGASSFEAITFPELVAETGVRLIEEWAVADGVTDDTAAVNTAVAACRAAGQWLDWGGERGKRVKITSALDYSTAGSYLWIAPDIDASAVTVGGSVSPKVTVRGPVLGSAILLSSNASARATQITTASALTVGAHYILQSNGTANGDGVTKRAELIKIRSLATGTTYNLEEPLQSSYTTANNAQVQLFSETVTFKCKGTFRLRGDSASTSINDYGLALWRLYGAELEKFHGTDIASCHMSVDLCVNSSICSDWGWFQRAKNTGQGYGIEIAGGYNLRHGDLWGEDLRHVRTFTHSTGSASHGALGNLLGRGLIGGHIMGDDMLSSADDSHAGFIDTVTGDCITNIAAGVTVPEAFVVEHSKAKMGRIIINGGDTNGLVVQSFGHPDSDQNYVEIESVSVNMTGAVNDWAGFVANRSGENSHGAQILFFKLGMGTFTSTQRGLKLVATSGAIYFDIGMLAVQHQTEQALLLESSANYGLIGVVNFIDARDGASSTGDLIYANAGAGDSITVTFNSGRLVKSGGSGALLRTAGTASIVTGSGLTRSPGAGGTVNVASNGSVLIPGQVFSATVASGSAVSLTTATPANVTSLSLTPGVWRVTGQAAFAPAATTSITILTAAINTTSATVPSPETVAAARNQQTSPAYVPNANQVLVTGEAILTLTATTTVYLVAQATFTVSTLGAFGKIQATRIS